MSKRSSSSSRFPCSSSTSKIEAWITKLCNWRLQCRNRIVSNHNSWKFCSCKIQHHWSLFHFINDLEWSKSKSELWKKLIERLTLSIFGIKFYNVWLAMISFNKFDQRCSSDSSVSRDGHGWLSELFDWMYWNLIDFMIEWIEAIERAVRNRKS
jgi:hypothetical protein